ncbi:hypothetical protein OWV82_002267 [Melia azedarach]|uniref:Uncharacterized protein n=1 Tax=Melia azedarach TaxID=155640 RepID=A0ACC1Z1Z8_MELAZ|nr:hypothetical protein OWV82_002267 [Melia azedarach]
MTSYKVVMEPVVVVAWEIPRNLVLALELGAFAKFNFSFRGSSSCTREGRDLCSSSRIMENDNCGPHDLDNHDNLLADSTFLSLQLVTIHLVSSRVSIHSSNFQIDIGIDGVLLL